MVSSKQTQKWQKQILCISCKSFSCKDIEASRSFSRVCLIRAYVQRIYRILLKFIYPEKATQFCKISTLLLSVGVCIYDFLRIYKHNWYWWKISSIIQQQQLILYNSKSFFEQRHSSFSIVLYSTFSKRIFSKNLKDTFIDIDGQSSQLNQKMITTYPVM